MNVIVTVEVASLSGWPNNMGRRTCNSSTPWCKDSRVSMKVDYVAVRTVFV